MIPLSPIPKEPPLYCFLMIGQSNMDGRGLLSEVPDFEHDDRIFIYGYDGQWNKGYEPVGDRSGNIYSVFDDNRERCSPCMSFANELCSLMGGFNVGIIPSAQNGTSMSDWERNLSTSSLYGAMKARSSSALNHPQSVLKGIIYYQGENDADNYTEATSWGGKFDDWGGDIRGDIGNVPIIRVVLGPTTDSNRPYMETVREQQRNASLSNSDYVTAEDLSLIDHIHLDTAAQITLGKRMAQKMAELI